MTKKTTPSNRRFGWLPPMLLFVAVFALLQWWRAAPLASGQAPTLAGELVGGGRADLTELRGAPVLVHFWASWCPICRLGDDEIDALAQDFRVITVAMQSGSASEVRSHLREEDLSFPAVNDPYGELASRWGVQAVPATFVVDGQGEIRFATVGHTTGVGLRARMWAATVD